MAFQKKKEVSIIKETEQTVRTSRKWQWGIVWGIILTVLFLIAVLTIVHLYNQSQELFAARPIPQRINFQSVDSLRFFDPKTGQPLIWYTKDAAGYVLYDAEGFDPSGTPLRAVTEQDVALIKQWTVELAQKRTEEEKRTEIVSLQSLFRFTAPAGTKVFVLGVDARDLPPSAKESCAEALSDQLATLLPTQTIKTDALTEDFFSRGYFDKAYTGDSGFLNEADVFNHTNSLLLLKPSVAFKPTSVEGVISCHLAISCKLYVSSTQETRQARFEATGPGLSEDASFKRAVEILFEINRDKINQLIAGTP